MEVLGKVIEFETPTPDDGLQGVPGSTGVQPRDLQSQSQDWRPDVVTKQKRITMGVFSTACSERRLNRPTPDQADLQVSIPGRPDCSLTVEHRLPSTSLI
jgi:hypothetical protein